MRHAFALLAVLGATAACKGALRAPVCQEGEFELPAGAAGRYRITNMSADPAMSGSWTGIEDFELEIGEEPSAYVVRAPRGKLARRLVGDDEPVRRILPLAVCKIGAAYYTQTQDTRGTYSLQRLDLSPTGVTTIDLLWKPAELERHGFRHVFLPLLEEHDAGRWTFGMLDPVRLVVDNADLPPARREELVQLAHPTLYGFVFSRIPDGERRARRADDLEIRLPKRGH